MRLRAFWLVLSAIFVTAARAQKPIEADVVILDDTSGSMKNNDPQNAIVLVTRLLADILPGKLAAVRLFDVGRDGARVGTTDTGKSEPCPDNPSITCKITSLAPDALDKAVNQRLLVISRPTRGDAGFKTQLPQVLKPTAMDTHYNFSLATIEKVFAENHSPPDTPRAIVWLSDGAPDAEDWPATKERMERLLHDGVSIQALTFRSGKADHANELGIHPNLIDGTPGALMKAFADAFRQIISAPYSVDGSVASNPTFAIKPRMEEAWIVVYGDESLSSASVSKAGKTIPANYASDHYNGSAYRVAYIQNPEEGNWTIAATGGGSDVSYAVIQRTSIAPYIYPPGDVFTGVPFRFEASLRSGSSNQDLLASDLPEPVTMEAIFEGQTVPLHDDGANGDTKTGDGRYSAMLTIQRPGQIAITVRARNSVMNKTAKITVDVRGYFRFKGGPVDIDFGSLKAGQSVCRPLTYEAEQQGTIPFELRPVAQLPRRLNLELRAGGKHTSYGGSPIALLGPDSKQICLVTGRDAETSQSRAQSWVQVAVNGRQDRESIVDLRLSWQVKSLTFWEKWGWLILLILAILLIWFIIYGFIKPFRFPPGLALCYAPAMDELDDQTPQPVKLWRGVGIGWYRDARACLRDDFRINGQVKGAVAILQAGARRAVIVKPGNRGLHREIGVAEWEPVTPNGRRAGQGEIYRVGDSGPYFRLSTRMAA